MHSVREKADGSLALSLSSRSVVWHYAIDLIREASTKLRIGNGPEFDNLMDVRIIFELFYFEL